MSNAQVEVTKSYEINEDDGYVGVEITVISGGSIVSTAKIMANLDYEDDLFDFRMAVESLESSLVDKAVENSNE